VIKTSLKAGVALAFTKMLFAIAHNFFYAPVYALYKEGPPVK
jgi:hypothetical protein